MTKKLIFLKILFIKQWIILKIYFKFYFYHSSFVVSVLQIDAFHYYFIFQIKNEPEDYIAYHYLELFLYLA